MIDHILPTRNLADLNFEGITMVTSQRFNAQDPYPLCAQQLEQNHGLLMTVFKDGS